MNRAKVFNSYLTQTINSFNGTIINEIDIKKMFGVNAGSVELIFIHQNNIFLITTKWDQGIMSTNNVNQYLKSCNHIITEVSSKDPIKYNYYKMIITKKNINFLDFKDAQGNPKLFNITLNEVDQNSIIPDSFDDELIERVCMRVYYFLAGILNIYPGIQEKDGDIKMTYIY